MSRFAAFASAPAFALAAALSAAPAAQAATVGIVDLDARIHVKDDGAGVLNPVLLFLDAGDYAVTPEAGTFTAWNAWFKNGGTANCQGAFCAKGYVNGYSFYTPDSADAPLATFFGGTGDAVRKAWRTPELALDAAVGAVFTLASAQNVAFLISDTPVRDNSGGMTLRVESLSPAAIPVPAAAPMLLAALGALAVAARRRARA